MELKNAVAVCLISLFSATLVVLIARSLDSQAASRLEPQLTAIAEELQAIRKQGGIAAAPGTTPQVEPASDQLGIYFFHATARCVSCVAVESTMEELLKTEFASQYNRGQIIWKTLDYEKPSSAELSSRFKVAGIAVVLARLKDNQLQDNGKSLDKVMALTGDKPALAAYLRDEIRQMLGAENAAARKAERLSIPTPTRDARKDQDTTPRGPPSIPGTDVPTVKPQVPKEPPPIPVPDTKTSEPAGAVEPPAIPIPE